MSTIENQTNSAVSLSKQANNLTCAMQSLEKGLSYFYNHQNETLRIHEQFLGNQSEYARSFFQIIQQQTQAGAVAFNKDITQSIAQFHNHQSETLRIHEQYLKHQTEYCQHSFELIRQQQVAFVNGGQAIEPHSITIADYQPPVFSVPKQVDSIPIYPSRTATVQPAITVSQLPGPVVAPVTAAPVTTGTRPVVTKSSLTATLLKVVSEKTGYQADMLELSMDMEADLGIDSIKRVEILNGIQEQLPDLPPLNPEELAELRTLEQIANYMNQQTVAPTTVTAAKLSVSTPIREKTVAPAVGKNGFIGVLLKVISEKTGYQADMLELSMDMEADLGIDSIKRVEILNGIQEQLPDLPPVNPEELAELRTLKQIADYMMPKSTPSVTAPIPTKADPIPANQISREALTKALLTVVSEKTGYLEEMLELSMDMEADLGIDSIKRVEILNGIQEKLPGFPEINPEELAELRTLEQIVTKMFQAGNAVAEGKPDSVKKKQGTGNTASIAG
jgi:acyl carrier protein